MPAAAISIRHARVRRARPGDRARLIDAFGAATPASTGVPERAVLLIRQLSADRPLAAHGDALQQNLIDLIRARKASARPSSQPGGDADLYFADADSVEIAAVAQWLGNGRVDPLLVALDPALSAPLTHWRRSLLGDVRRLPGLVLRLIERGLAEPWLARFEDRELAAASARLLAEHGVATALPEPPMQSGKTAPASPPHPHTSLPAAIHAVLVQASHISTRPALRQLVAVTAIAAQRPDLLPTRALRPWLGWIAAPHGSRPDRAAPAPPDPLQPTSTARSQPADLAMPADQPSPQRPAPRPPARTPAARTPAARRAAPPSAAPPPGAAAQPKVPAPGTPFIADPELPELRPVVPVSSRYAGLLFLLNVLLALGLYGDFTRPGDTLRGLSPFELLVLLGRRWFGADFARDPVDPLLRRLAALGPRERPGQSFEAPPWRIGSDWLAPWPPAAPVLRRGQPWHPAGFPLADTTPQSGTPAQRRHRWLAALERYLSARIARALGTADRRGALAQVVHQRGELRVEGEEVVIAFALDAHPIELRLAGIDRDPGWVPSLGRTIRFEFT